MQSETHSDERVNSFAMPEALDDFKPKDKPLHIPSKTEIDKLINETGFISRQRQTNRGTRYKTGRNQQLNLKVTVEAMDKFYQLADEMNLPLGEVFYQGIQALIERRSINKPGQEPTATK